MLCPSDLSFLIQKPLSFMKSHLLIVDPSACVNSVLLRKFISCANEVKTIPQFLLYQSQFIWLYCKFFDTFWLELGMGWWMWIYLYFSVFRHPAWLTSLVKTLPFFPVHFWLVYQKSGTHRYMDLFLVLPLDFIDQWVCFVPK